MSPRPTDNHSVHSGDSREVYDIPMAAIRRPIPSVLDEEKVSRFVEILQDPTKKDSLIPIDDVWVDANDSPDGKDYYYAFGGCHRWAAHIKTNSETVRGKLIKVSPQTINTYLGASSPFFNSDG